MAEGFKSSQLSVLAYANNFTLWHYTTPDTKSEIEATGYFNSASDMLRVNDLVIANYDNDGMPGTKFYLVTSNVNGGVGLTIYS